MVEAMLRFGRKTGHQNEEKLIHLLGWETYMSNEHSLPTHQLPGQNTTERKSKVFEVKSEYTS